MKNMLIEGTIKSMMNGIGKGRRGEDRDEPHLNKTPYPFPLIPPVTILHPRSPQTPSLIKTPSPSQPNSIPSPSQTHPSSKPLYLFIDIRSRQ